MDEFDLYIFVCVCVCVLRLIRQKVFESVNYLPQIGASLLPYIYNIYNSVEPLFERDMCFFLLLLVIQTTKQNMGSKNMINWLWWVGAALCCCCAPVDLCGLWLDLWMNGDRHEREREREIDFSRNRLVWCVFVEQIVSYVFHIWIVNIVGFTYNKT